MTVAREARELIAQLVGIESVNPTLVPGGAGEGEIAAFVARWLERTGLTVVVEEVATGRRNVIATAAGSGGGRTLMLNAHMDTVSLGGRDGALEPRVEGDRLYGRGSYDMKGSLAAIMLVAAELGRRPLAGDVVLTAVSDEEAGSIGTEAVVGSSSADAAIVAEPTELRLAVAHRGFVALEIETHGRAAHGSRYDLGVDAIVRMAPILAALGELDERLSEREPHPLLGRPSVHASLIEGGQELSSYPARCILTLERRTLPGESPELVEEEAREAAGDAADVRRLFAREPLETPRDEAIVKLVRETAARVLGRKPDVIGVPFWTDAALLSAAGIPTVVFGPAGEGAHAEVEWVDLPSVERCVEVFLATAEAFCAPATQGGN
jgi:acetylornithine deacetylase